MHIKLNIKDLYVLSYGKLIIQMKKGGFIMYTFIGGLLVLLAGYFFFSKYVEKQLDVDGKAETPAYKLKDGVDFIPMPTWKVYLIQFLNIAGLGPIFGALMGALYGPVAFIWVILGNVLGGAVHDYVSGVISLRHNGASLSEIYGIYLGKKVQALMRVITVFFCVIVGVVAMVWVAAGLAFYKGTPGLGQIILGKAGSTGAVFEISNTLLGKFGGMLAIMGVNL